MNDLVLTGRVWYWNRQRDALKAQALRLSNEKIGKHRDSRVADVLILTSSMLALVRGKDTKTIIWETRVATEEEQKDIPIPPRQTDMFS